MWLARGFIGGIVVPCSYGRVFPRFLQLQPNKRLLQRLISSLILIHFPSLSSLERLAHFLLSILAHQTSAFGRSSDSPVAYMKRRLQEHHSLINYGCGGPSWTRLMWDSEHERSQELQRLTVMGCRTWCTSFHSHDEKVTRDES